MSKNVAAKYRFPSFGNHDLQSPQKEWDPRRSRQVLQDPPRMPIHSRPDGRVRGVLTLCVTGFLCMIAVSRDVMFEVCYRHGLLCRERACARCGEPATWTSRQRVSGVIRSKSRRGSGMAGPPRFSWVPFWSAPRLRNPADLHDPLHPGGVPLAWCMFLMHYRCVLQCHCILRPRTSCRLHRASINLPAQRHLLIRLVFYES